MAQDNRGVRACEGSRLQGMPYESGANSAPLPFWPHRHWRERDGTNWATVDACRQPAENDVADDFLSIFGNERNRDQSIAPQSTHEGSFVRSAKREPKQGLYGRKICRRFVPDLHWRCDFVGGGLGKLTRWKKAGLSATAPRG